jgi:putative transposase
MDSTVRQRFFQPLLLLLAQATDKHLAEYLQFLKAENRILRSKLPTRVNVTEAEKEKLLKLGKPIGRAIKDLITIVSPRTFARWVSQEGKEKKPAAARGKGGRPRKSDGVREMVLKFASESTGWGASRIHGELTKLGVRISDPTVRRILIENGFEPGPKRADSTWKEFLKRHKETL